MTDDDLRDAVTRVFNHLVRAGVFVFFVAMLILAIVWCAQIGWASVLPNLAADALGISIAGVVIPLLRWFTKAVHRLLRLPPSDSETEDR